eukprot:scaffold5113_cov364-Pinguiococcus_pyrenoidosus.AAC.5
MTMRSTKRDGERAFALHCCPTSGVEDTRQRCAFLRSLRRHWIGGVLREDARIVPSVPQACPRGANERARDNVGRVVVIVHHARGGDPRCQGRRQQTKQQEHVGGLDLERPQREKHGPGDVGLSHEVVRGEEQGREGVGRVARGERPSRVVRNLGALARGRVEVAFIVEVGPQIAAVVLDHAHGHLHARHGEQVAMNERHAVSRHLKLGRRPAFQGLFSAIFPASFRAISPVAEDHDGEKKRRGAQLIFALHEVVVKRQVLDEHRAGTGGHRLRGHWALLQGHSQPGQEAQDHEEHQ